MSANSHAYNTVFTVHSLPAHVYIRPVPLPTVISVTTPSFKNAQNLSNLDHIKTKTPHSKPVCPFIVQSILTSRTVQKLSPRKVNQVSLHEEFMRKQALYIEKMRLGKPHIIAYIWVIMHDAVKDEQLMLQYKDGDSRAFEILYSRYRLPMFRYLQNQCGNAAIAEEIFQDVWMNLVRARERYEVTASFKTYIYRLAHNRLIDHYRKQKHGVPSSYDEHEGLLNMDETANHISPQRQVAVEQQVDRLLNAIAELPEAQREAFLLKEETGLSVEEIATMTNVKPETAKSRIRYAMNKLKQAVEIEQYG